LKRAGRQKIKINVFLNQHNATSLIRHNRLHKIWSYYCGDY